MPNWCSNSLTVSINPDSKDKRVTSELKAFYHENKGSVDGDRQDLTFNAGVPVPNNLNSEQSYDFRVREWGTKWEANEIHFEDQGDLLVYNFETAWAPPIAWLEKISKFYPNLILRMEFEEPGMGIYGGVEAKDGDISEWENDQPGDPDSEIELEEAYDILVDGGEIMIRGWDINEPRLYAGVMMDDFNGMSKEEIIDQLSEYDSIQFW